MSNDLISKKALINALFVHNGKMWPDTDIDNFPTTINVKDVKEAIRNAPTAYDVDKVVEQLQRLSDIADDKIMAGEGLEQYWDGFGDGVDEVVKILKPDGIE